jgi:hypothetical protein
MKNKIAEFPAKGEIVIYQAKNKEIRLEVKLEQETVWLSQEQIAELFKTERSVITKHLGNIFRSNELDEKSNVHFLHIPFSDKPVKFYNLDVIISVGYRVNSSRATQFRIWATNVLKQHLVEGYTINEKRLKKQEQKYLELKNAVSLIGNMVRIENLLVIEKAKTVCLNSRQNVSDHFVDVNKMIDLGKESQRQVDDVMLTRYDRKLGELLKSRQKSRVD